MEKQVSVVNDFDFAKSVYLDFIKSDYTVTWGGQDKQSDWTLDKAGQKYQRVIHTSMGGQRSVHSFIVLRDHTTKQGLVLKQGDILKAASWKAPAMNFTRGNILEQNYVGRVRWTGVG